MIELIGYIVVRMRGKLLEKLFNFWQVHEDLQERVEVLNVLDSAFSDTLALILNQKLVEVLLVLINHFFTSSIDMLRLQPLFTLDLFFLRGRPSRH